jgi:hypothetical protein
MIIHEGKPLATRGKQFSSRDVKIGRQKIVRECELLSSTKLHVMKQIILLVLILLMTPALAQTPAQKEEDEFTALIKEVQAQQATIAENQAKIDEKVATLAETIREARIFSSRGGR